jgi:hypothetical protein
MEAVVPSISSLSSIKIAQDGKVLLEKKDVTFACAMGF